MAEQRNKPATATKPDEVGNQSAVDSSRHGDHDRVAVLSLRADGTPDQQNPEIISDPEVALAYTKDQFRTQAVSAADQRERAALAGPVTIVGKPDGEDDEVVPARSEPDPATAELKAAHDKAAGRAEANAERTVAALLPDEKAKP